MVINNKQFQQGLLNLVKRLNSFNLDGSPKDSYHKFYVDDKHVGYVCPSHVDVLKNYEQVFCHNAEKVWLNPGLVGFQARTDAVEQALLDMKAKGHFAKTLNGWRNEHFFVRARFSDEPLFEIERSAVGILGIKAYGCHINGYIKKNDEYFIWIARRSKTKQTYPGMLDNFTGGGFTAGLGLMECARKELEEEAGIAHELTKNLKPVDAITYAYIKNGGCVSMEGEFVFDLKLPVDLVPRNTDGEVECFYLMSVDEVKEAVVSDEFKANSAAITLGFLFRKGLLNADEIPCYLEILENLHAQGL